MRTEWATSANALLTLTLILNLALTLTLARRRGRTARWTAYPPYPTTIECVNRAVTTCNVSWSWALTHASWLGNLEKNSSIRNWVLLVFRLRKLTLQTKK